MSEGRSLYTFALRLAIQLIVLAIVNWLLTELPMMKVISIPGMPFPITACISAVIGIIMIVILLLFRSDFVPKLRTRFPQHPYLGSIVSDALSLIIVVVAFTSLEGIIKPFMNGYTWTYALVFLVIALWPLIALITTLYRSSTPFAEWLSTVIARGGERGGTGTKCAACGRDCPEAADFCTECGAQLTLPAAAGVKCPACGAPNRPAQKHCMKCGALLEDDEQYDTRVSI